MSTREAGPEQRRRKSGTRRGLGAGPSLGRCTVKELSERGQEAGRRLSTGWGQAQGLASPRPKGVTKVLFVHQPRQLTWLIIMEWL